MTRFGMWIRGALACVCCLAMSGCDFIVSDTESLLSRPTLNDQQARVYAALEDTLNITDIEYRYIQRGDFRSPFVFFDMDGDGSDEAIVFYAFAADPSSTRTMILRRTGDGDWSPLYDFPVHSEQVDFVQFAHLLSQESYCMIIGWQGAQGQSSRSTDRFLGIYSLSGGSFNTEVDSQPYVEYIIQDFDSDGLDEIVTVYRERGQFRISLLRSIGRHIDITASIPLSYDADTLLHMTTGRLWDNSAAVYIDELRIDTSVATEVFQVTRNGMNTLAGGDPPESAEEAGYSWENYQYTFRDEPILSRDVNGDGRVLVPASPLALPGNVEDGMEYPLQLTPMMEMTAYGFDEQYRAVINETEGYLLRYPDRWVDAETGEFLVTVQRDDENGEWRFFLVDRESGELTVELLRIQSYTAREAGAAGPDEIYLGSRGTRHFTAYIPRTGTAAALTEPDLRALFTALP